MAAIGFHLQVPIGPDWRNVELLRGAILNCLAAVFQNNDFCETVGMVAGELVENAIKYGAWDGIDHSGFELRVSGADDGVQVEVSNPVDPGSDDAESLRQALAHLASFPSPQEAYLARLGEVAAAAPGSETSRLGLARIAYEGNCKLEVAFDGGLVIVRAVAKP